MIQLMRALNRRCFPSLFGEILQFNANGTTNITLNFGWTSTTRKSVGSDQRYSIRVSQGGRKWHVLVRFLSVTPLLESKRRSDQLRPTWPRI
ncbi:hypothetical protein HanHA89_Chr03g0120311 [Helianthus annuus]|nr:hypothetical protein HanHA89_Chr03g0120311 [Helianthus annuus]